MEKKKITERTQEQKDADFKEVLRPMLQRAKAEIENGERYGR